MMSPDILGYVADILWADGSREVRYLTAAERTDLIGDGRVAAATYVPLTAAPLGALPTAWFVKSPSASRVVSDWGTALAFLETGHSVTCLIIGTQPVERT